MFNFKYLDLLLIWRRKVLLSFFSLVFGNIILSNGKLRLTRRDRTWKFLCSMVSVSLVAFWFAANCTVLSDPWELIVSATSEASSVSSLLLPVVSSSLLEMQSLSLCCDSLLPTTSWNFHPEQAQLLLETGRISPPNPSWFLFLPHDFSCSVCFSFPTEQPLMMP